VKRQIVDESEKAFDYAGTAHDVLSGLSARNFIQLMHTNVLC